MNREEIENFEIAENDAPAPVPVVYLVPWEKYLYATDRAWSLAYPVARAGIIQHLIAQGLDRENAERRAAECDKAYGVKMAPGKNMLLRSRDGRLYVNRWVPPTVQAAPGDWSQIRRLIEHMTGYYDPTTGEVIHDPDGALWLINWLAARVQQPMVKAGTAVILVGPPGSGKTTLTRILRLILGHENTAEITQADLDGQFNSHYAGKLLVVADEVGKSSAAGNRLEFDGKLKNLITSTVVMVNAKGLKQYEDTNPAAFIFTTNSANPVNIEEGDRRYTVFANRMPLASTEYQTFVKDLSRAIDQKFPDAMAEVAAFLHELQTLPIDQAQLFEPHRNTARDEIRVLSMTSTEAFLACLAEEGIDTTLERLANKVVVLFGGPREVSIKRPEGAPRAYDKAALYNAYRAYCDEAGFRNPVTERSFTQALTRAHWTQVRGSGGNRAYGVQPPAAPKLRAVS